MTKLNNILVLGKNCCGCGGCKDVCPKNSISFKADSEGFLYPHIDASCVDCGLCLKHCPIANQVEKPQLQQVYGARIKEDSLLMKSSSGGIFPELALAILRKNGVVFGCAFDEKLTAHHIAVESEKDLEKLQGSKYVQSNTLGVFSQVKKALEQDRYVLFSGTGCQVAGLKAFLKKDFEKLLTVDVVCHGVPSPKLFENYLCYLSGKEKAEITDYNFRSKDKKGWGLFYKYTGKNIRHKDGFFDPYYYAFLKGRSYRESCYNCKFANENRQSDITLADFWSIKTEHPDFYSKKGSSAVIVNSKKGKQYFDWISERLEYVVSNFEKASKLNTNLVRPSARPESRSNFYKGFQGDLNLYFEKKLKPPFQLKRRIKSIVPEKVKIAVRKALHKS